MIYWSCGILKVLVGECFVLVWSSSESSCGWNGSENVGLSSENMCENYIFWNFKGFFGWFVCGGWVRI